MSTMGIIFSNIYDNNMGELTAMRTSASIPFGSRYRQVDFVLSNMANSGIKSIGIITKYNYQSLMDHLGNCEEWDLKLGDGVRFLPPYATGHTGAYHGKLEALQTAMPVLERSDAEYVVLSDTTVLCAINFRLVISAPAATSRSSPRRASPTAKRSSTPRSSSAQTARSRIWPSITARRRITSSA